MENLLVVEDDGDLRTQMKWSLAGDYRVIEAGDRNAALEAFTKERPKVVTLDLGLPPDGNGVTEGFRALSEILETDPLSKVIVITGQGDRSNAIAAVGNGACDFLTKPVDPEELRITLKRAFEVAELEKEYHLLQDQLKWQSFEGMLGASPSMSEVYEKIRKVAAAEVPVLLFGESGTGKELAARAIHGLSLRKEGAFIPINCGAIPETLLESELFGHEKGAFTGAHVQRQGRFETAHRGTLFLDEIGELSPALQVKLLRFLQDQRIERVGGRNLIQVDVRIVAATNKDLAKSIEKGEFREDLYYRLGVVTISIPSLKEREGDILLLARTFLRKFSSERGGKAMSFTPAAEKAMEEYHWPGNIREMENRVRRAVIMADDNRITPKNLELAGLSITGKGGGPSLRQAREQVERDLIVRSIERNRGNLTRVARELEISRPALYDLMKKLHLEKD
ncbi:MAG: PEP-CTERM-box response regulator transcription factor [Proteobacteria bacterium]|nr:PEP-CTERM-box response regulator transcription factor [Pseudomonadota bacterium]